MSCHWSVATVLATPVMAYTFWSRCTAEATVPIVEAQFRALNTLPAISFPVFYTLVYIVDASICVLTGTCTVYYGTKLATYKFTGNILVTCTIGCC